MVDFLPISRLCLTMCSEPKMKQVQVQVRVSALDVRNQVGTCHLKLTDFKIKNTVLVIEISKEATNNVF